MGSGALDLAWLVGSFHDDMLSCSREGANTENEPPIVKAQQSPVKEFGLIKVSLCNTAPPTQELYGDGFRLFR